MDPLEDVANGRPPILEDSVHPIDRIARDVFEMAVGHQQAGVRRSDAALVAVRIRASPDITEAQQVGRIILICAGLVKRDSAPLIGAGEGPHDNR